MRVQSGSNMIQKESSQIAEAPDQPQILISENETLVSKAAVNLLTRHQPRASSLPD